ncbi:hypothetical protein CTA1_5180 [Colletotrichum tanaceti]|uniref:Uncharacterized protein n=1 Tax=Colletotrichum tanaceti TaxID=1306861 RepID=A0A4U6XRF2_9PEZI|nr:hypothetical protein CTA1_5180 [Colletotrichum tanaceti]
MYLYPAGPTADGRNPSLVAQGLPELLAAGRRGLDGLVDDVLEAGGLEALQRGVRRAVGAGDVLAQLAGRLGRLDEHLAGAEAGLGGQALRLVGREAEADGAGDEVLDHGEELLLVDPLGGLADARHERLGQLLLVVGDVGAGEQARGALADEGGGVGHDADDVGRAAVVEGQPLLQGLEGDAGGDGDDDGDDGGGGGGGELVADGLGDLGLDGQDGDVGAGKGLGVGGGRPDAEGGHLVAVHVPRLRDGDVLLIDALGDQASDDGRGHIAAAWHDFTPRLRLVPKLPHLHHHLHVNGAVSGLVAGQDVDRQGRLVRRARPAEVPLEDGERHVPPRLLDPARAVQEARADVRVARGHEGAVALDEPAVDEHVLDVADAGVQDDGGHGVDPAEQRGAAAVPDDDVGLGALGDDAQVGPAQGEAAVARGQQEGLVGRHGRAGRHAPVLEHLLVEQPAGALQPEAGLRQDVGREGEVRVDPQGALVLHQVAVRVRVPVVHLRLGRDGDVLVRRPEEGGPSAVRRDDGDVELLGEVEDGVDIGEDGVRAEEVAGDAQAGRGAVELGPGGHVPKVHELVRDGVVGDVVEGVRPEDAGAAVDAPPQPGLGGLVGPGVVGVVQRGGDAGVERLVQAGELADVDVVGAQQAGGGYSASDVLEAMVLKAVCHPWRCVSTKPGVMILPVASTTSVSLVVRGRGWSAVKMDVMRSSVMRSEPLRTTLRALVAPSKATMVPPRRSTEDALARLAVAVRAAANVKECMAEM